jgi:hypothetical protein
VVTVHQGWDWDIKIHPMDSPKDLNRIIATFHDRLTADAHHRYRSWEHCFRYFRSKRREELISEKRAAALQLGFYLASWGMYRGSSFLLGRTYTVHEGVIERLGSSQFDELWTRDVGSDPSDTRLVQTILAAVDSVKAAYAPYGRATDTLATKVLLGTLACIPACDRFFREGFRLGGQPYSYLNASFVKRIIGFCNDHRDALRSEQARIAVVEGMHYPLMKLADMYFWQIGYNAAIRSGVEPEIPE